MKKPSQGRLNAPFHLHAKKSLGQHFLNAPSIVEKIVIHCEALCKDKVKPYFIEEIGPGSGVLTHALLEKNFHVLSIEKDERAIEQLKTTLQANFNGKFEVVQGDILKWVPSHANQANSTLNSLPLCVGNIPYYITSDILFWFARHKHAYSHGIFMMQNEVAQRLVARPGTKSYGRLSVIMQLLFNMEKIIDVPAGAFVPPPKVDSAVVTLEPTVYSFESLEEEKSFSKFTTLLFSARREMLRRVFATTLKNVSTDNDSFTEDFWQFCQTHNLTEQTRPDTLPVPVILKMHQLFWQKKIPFVIS